MGRKQGKAIPEYFIVRNPHDGTFERSRLFEKRVGLPRGKAIQYCMKYTFDQHNIPYVMDYNTQQLLIINEGVERFKPFLEDGYNLTSDISDWLTTQMNQGESDSKELTKAIKLSLGLVKIQREKEDIKHLRDNISP